MMAMLDKAAATAYRLGDKEEKRM
ncbi:hypothetical protein SKA58_15077 [Sphingomonas sp. SKA58]|nr:hypothetical protein SKA58_15077 [Sphingomonas sp. SKA58]